jgi:hypothetical protein
MIQKQIVQSKLAADSTVVKMIPHIWMVQTIDLQFNTGVSVLIAIKAAQFIACLFWQSLLSAHP